MDGSYSLVAVSDEEGDCSVDDEAYDSQNPECPGQAKPGNHSVRGQRIA